MCKKLSILCLTLVVVALSAPASAAPSLANPLLLDINGDNAGGATARTQAGWTGWDIARDPGAGALTKDMQATHNTTITIRGIRNDAANPGTRNRYQADGSDLSNVYQDLYFAGHSGGVGVGMDYIKVDLTISGLVPNSTNSFGITLYAWDPAFGFNSDIAYGGAGEPKNSKLAAWSLTNPRTWLINNSYPDGYKVANVEPMPAGLAATLLGGSAVYAGKTDLGLVPQLGHRTEDVAWWGWSWDNRYATTFTLDLVASDDIGDGTGVAYATIYGWNHMTTWSGSQHTSLNGIKIVPEPATVALLGLGGLALLRRRKRA
jgi:hypothetical protein